MRARSDSSKSDLWLFLPDIHWPETDRATLRAMFAFLEANRRRVGGVVLGGDQLDNQEVSRHTKGQPGLRNRAGYFRNTSSFDREILRPVEALLPKRAERIWIVGNHCDWENDLVAESPELDGIQRPQQLRLMERGWLVVKCGDTFRHGKLEFLHGDQLSGQYHARKCVDTYCTSVLYGHFHSLQAYTRILPNNRSQRWVAYCSPIMGALDPAYLKGKPTGWVNGFSIVEFRGRGNFNVFPVVVTEGEFSYGGRTYGGRGRK